MAQPSRIDKAQEDAAVGCFLLFTLTLMAIFWLPLGVIWCANVLLDANNPYNLTHWTAGLVLCCIIFTCTVLAGRVLK